MLKETYKVDLGDALMHVRIYGKGPPLILLAGLGGRGAFWHGQIEAFAASHRLIVPDHRGCGDSTRGKCVSSIAHMASDFMRMMDTLDIERSKLVGHSTGGAIGQYLAIFHPERINRLVLSSSWAGPDTYFTKLFEHRKTVLQQCGPEAYLWQGMVLAIPTNRLQPIMKSGENIISERLAQFPGVDVELSRINAVMGHNLRERLHEISVPTLCTAALDDQITPPSFTQELAANIAGAQIHLFERGGHFCPTTETEEYNKRVYAFLNQKGT
ncbi:alpha/beta fold hydrolase [uncultured Parasphingorhabdus sp.]|uniref:alpha/beta fold hydrolase n=1 Tax=uncultured Parasphingorhabdus sp. TaxID=2709694 RepID=UPI002AA89160|nr:alpha/beta fold hydrolase [uncultured Parasphingorhabdus sp.]